VIFHNDKIAFVFRADFFKAEIRNFACCVGAWIEAFLFSLWQQSVGIAGRKVVTEVAPRLVPRIPSTAKSTQYKQTGAPAGRAAELMAGRLVSKRLCSPSASLASTKPCSVLGNRACSQWKQWVEDLCNEGATLQTLHPKHDSQPPLVTTRSLLSDVGWAPAPDGNDGPRICPKRVRSPPPPNSRPDFGKQRHFNQIAASLTNPPYPPA